MRATVMYRAGDVRIENLPDAHLIEPTDALIRISRACVCGSDLWPYKLLDPQDKGRRMGHEAIGVVESIGAEVRRLKVGDVVVMPFAYSDGTCDFCRDGLNTSCVHGGFFGTGGNVTVSGGPAPVRAYIAELLPDVLEGRIEPGLVFDRTVGLEAVPQAYRDMDQRKALKVMIKP